MKDSCSKVIFYNIKTPKQKLIRLTQTAQSHFNSKTALCIICSDETAQKFVDELLWKEPILSFLPHGSSDLIAIGNKNFNPNNATHFFNLDSSPLLLKNIFTVYEFDDQTSLVKAEISQKKHKSYREKGFQIDKIGL